MRINQLLSAWVATWLTRRDRVGDGGGAREVGDVVVVFGRELLVVEKGGADCASFSKDDACKPIPFVPPDFLCRRFLKTPNKPRRFFFDGVNEALPLDEGLIVSFMVIVCIVESLPHKNV